MLRDDVAVCAFRPRKSPVDERIGNGGLSKRSAVFKLITRPQPYLPERLARRLEVQHLGRYKAWLGTSADNPIQDLGSLFSLRIPSKLPSVCNAVLP